MINFKRNGLKVIAEIECNVGVDKRFFQFTLDTNDEIYAVLLQENFQAFLRSSAERIRREAYEKGFKDAKAKRAKDAWFSGHF